MLLQELAKGGSQETKQQEADKVKDNDSSCQLIASRYIPAMKSGSCSRHCRPTKRIQCGQRCENAGLSLPSSTQCRI
ncbi:hypothetical protein PF007_g16619 [Phytophthora fragariae]|uniref:Uncharacterized protein n=1 Tax=Phytophthora fragariae TaxID=53985 RepID=A0A6A3RHU7_9STRA|nr:hypothetical protein PF007_g16619 [Phytophthora fragariae]